MVQYTSYTNYIKSKTNQAICCNTKNATCIDGGTSSGTNSATISQEQLDSIRQTFDNSINAIDASLQQLFANNLTNEFGIQIYDTAAFFTNSINDASLNPTNLDNNPIVLSSDISFGVNNDIPFSDISTLYNSDINNNNRILINSPSGKSINAGIYNISKNADNELNIIRRSSDLKNDISLNSNIYVFVKYAKKFSSGSDLSYSGIGFLNEKQSDVSTVIIGETSLNFIQFNDFADYTDIITGDNNIIITGEFQKTTISLASQIDISYLHVANDVSINGILTVSGDVSFNNLTAKDVSFQSLNILPGGKLTISGDEVFTIKQLKASFVQITQLESSFEQLLIDGKDASFANVDISKSLTLHDASLVFYMGDTSAITIVAPQDLSSSYTLKLPISYTEEQSGNFLRVDGSGQLYFADASLDIIDITNGDNNLTISDKLIGGLKTYTIDLCNNLDLSTIILDSSLTFQSQDGSAITIVAPSNVSEDYTLKLPISHTEEQSGNFLRVDGSGQLYFADASLDIIDIRSSDHNLTISNELTDGVKTYTIDLCNNLDLSSITLDTDLTFKNDGKITFEAQDPAHTVTIDISKSGLNESYSLQLPTITPEHGISDTGTKIYSDKAFITVDKSGNMQFENLQNLLDSANTGINAREAVRYIAYNDISNSYIPTNDISGLIVDFSAGNAIGNLTAVADFSYGDRILINNFSNQILNGIYTISGEPVGNNIPVGDFSFLLVRASDFDEKDEAHNAFVFVNDGPYKNTGWILSYQDSSSILIGENSLNFVQFTGEQTTIGNGDDTNIKVTKLPVGNTTEITLSKNINIDSVTLSNSAEIIFAGKDFETNLILKAPEDDSYTLTLPKSTDTSGAYMRVDASGHLYFEDISLHDISLVSSNPNLTISSEILTDNITKKFTFDLCDNLTVTDLTISGGELKINYDASLTFQSQDGSAIIIVAPHGISNEYTLILPKSKGTNGQILTVSGDSGQLIFKDLSGISNETISASNVIISSSPKIINLAGPNFHIKEPTNTNNDVNSKLLYLENLINSQKISNGVPLNYFQPLTTFNSDRGTNSSNNLYYDFDGYEYFMFEQAINYINEKNLLHAINFNLKSYLSFKSIESSLTNYIDSFYSNPNIPFANVYANDFYLKLFNLANIFSKNYDRFKDNGTKNDLSNSRLKSMNDTTWSLIEDFQHNVNTRQIYFTNTPAIIPGLCNPPYYLEASNNQILQKFDLNQVKIDSSYIDVSFTPLMMLSSKNIEYEQNFAMIRDILTNSNTGKEGSGNIIFYFYQQNSHNQPNEFDDIFNSTTTHINSSGFIFNPYYLKKDISSIINDNCVNMLYDYGNIMFALDSSFNNYIDCYDTSKNIDTILIPSIPTLNVFYDNCHNDISFNKLDKNDRDILGISIDISSDEYIFGFQFSCSNNNENITISDICLCEYGKSNNLFNNIYDTNVHNIDSKDEPTVIGWNTFTSLNNTNQTRITLNKELNSIDISYIGNSWNNQSVVYNQKILQSDLSGDLSFVLTFDIKGEKTSLHDIYNTFYIHKINDDFKYLFCQNIHPEHAKQQHSDRTYSGAPPPYYLKPINNEFPSLEQIIINIPPTSQHYSGYFTFNNISKHIKLSYNAKWKTTDNDNTENYMVPPTDSTNTSLIINYNMSDLSFVQFYVESSNNTIQTGSGGIHYTNLNDLLTNYADNSKNILIVCPLQQNVYQTYFNINQMEYIQDINFNRSLLRYYPLYLHFYKQYTNHKISTIVSTNQSNTANYLIFGDVSGTPLNMNNIYNNLFFPQENQPLYLGYYDKINYMNFGDYDKIDISYINFVQSSAVGTRYQNLLSSIIQSYSINSNQFSVDTIFGLTHNKSNIYSNVNAIEQAVLIYIQYLLYENSSDICNNITNLINQTSTSVYDYYKKINHSPGYTSNDLKASDISNLKVIQAIAGHNISDIESFTTIDEILESSWNGISLGIGENTRTKIQQVNFSFSKLSDTTILSDEQNRDISIILQNTDIIYRDNSNQNLFEDTKIYNYKILIALAFFYKNSYNYQLGGGMFSEISNNFYNDPSFALFIINNDTIQLQKVASNSINEKYIELEDSDVTDSCYNKIFIHNKNRAHCLIKWKKIYKEAWQYLTI